jgi:hypothetical protein
MAYGKKAKKKKKAKAKKKAPKPVDPVADQFWKDRAAAKARGRRGGF